MGSLREQTVIPDGDQFTFHTLRAVAVLDNSKKVSQACSRTTDETPVELPPHPVTGAEEDAGTFSRYSKQYLAMIRSIRRPRS